MAETTPHRISQVAEEEWRTIPGFGGAYEASDLGRVRSVPRVVKTSLGRTRRVRGKVLSLTKGKGYPNCVLKGQTRAVHRLVCRAFHGEPQPRQHAAHLDGTRDNNRPSNLKWCSPSENSQHRWAHGTMLAGEMSPGARFTEAAILETIRKVAGGETLAAAVRATGCGYFTLAYVIHGKRWPHLRAMNEPLFTYAASLLAAKPFCKYGHPLSGANLHISKSSGQRKCLACEQEFSRQSYAKKKLLKAHLEAGHGEGE